MSLSARREFFLHRGPLSRHIRTASTCLPLHLAAREEWSERRRSGASRRQVVPRGESLVYCVRRSRSGSWASARVSAKKRSQKNGSICRQKTAARLSTTL